MELRSHIVSHDYFSLFFAYIQQSLMNYEHLICHSRQTILFIEPLNILKTICVIIHRI